MWVPPNTLLWSFPQSIPLQEPGDLFHFMVVSGHKLIMLIFCSKLESYLLNNEYCEYHETTCKVSHTPRAFQPSEHLIWMMSWWIPSTSGRKWLERRLHGMQSFLTRSKMIKALESRLSGSWLLVGCLGVEKSSDFPGKKRKQKPTGKEGLLVFP